MILGLNIGLKTSEKFLISFERTIMVIQIKKIVFLHKDQFGSPNNITLGLS